MSNGKNKLLIIRLTQDEYKRLRSFAKRKDTSMAEILRTYVKKLPKIEDEQLC